MTRIIPLAIAFTLTACSAEPAPVAAPNTVEKPAVAEGARATPVAPATTAAPAVPVLAIEGEGLRLFNPVTGSARPIPFSTPSDATLAALAFRGPPKLARLEECGAGPLDQAAWPDGLRVYFQDDKFVGWALGALGKDRTRMPAITTASGIGPGSTRAELEAAYSARVMQSTLGTEFTAGELAGLIDGPGSRARITNLWAGASCNFR